MFSITLYTFKVDSYLIVFHSFLSLQFMSSVYFYGHVICIGWLLVYYAGLGGGANRGLGGGANRGLGGGANRGLGGGANRELGGGDRGKEDRNKED